MGKQAGPSPEELELIFGCFVRGLSDREVLEEMGDTEFPIRSIRFIRERRREFHAASKVLETGIKQRVDPLMIKAKGEHLEEIRVLIERWKDAFNPIPPPKLEQLTGLDMGTPTPIRTHRIDLQSF